MIKQSTGSTLMAVAVIGLVGWIGYENARIRSATRLDEMNSESPYVGGSFDTNGGGRETHDLRMVEIGPPDLFDPDGPQSELRVEFSKAEWEAVKQQADACNVSVTTYVREKLLDPECPIRS